MDMCVWVRATKERWAKVVEHVSCLSRRHVLMEVVGSTRVGRWLYGKQVEQWHIPSSTSLPMYLSEEGGSRVTALIHNGNGCGTERRC
jgi:hypothetical protein